MNPGLPVTAVLAISLTSMSRPPVWGDLNRSPFAGPDADRVELEGDVDQDQLGGEVGRELEIRGTADLCRIARPDLIAVDRHATVDHVQIPTATRAEAVLQVVAVAQ